MPFEFFDIIAHAKATYAQFCHVNIAGDECGWSMDAPDDIPAGSTCRVEPMEDAQYATEPFAVSSRTWRG